MFQRIKGTQDFLDLTLFNFIINQASKHLENHHFTQIQTPILEPAELFKRSLGLETDVVTKEMYFVQSESESICLRPEGTAPTVRAFIENNIQQIPWKVFSWGPMFRHERPQKGRFRQFNQLTMEIIGAASVKQDVYFIAMLDRLFSQVLTFDSYALMINYLGDAQDRAAFKQTLYQFLTDVQDKICETCKIRKETNIMRVFDCKVETCKQVYQDAPHLVDSLCAPCQAEWQTLQEQLEMLSVSYSVQHTLVRGLDYYNKTVFEFVSGSLGAQNAFCGGGRYDPLIAQVRGKESNHDFGLGAAIGIERLMIMLDQIKDRLPLPQPPALHVVIPLSPAQKFLAIMVAQELTSKNLCAEVLLENDSVKSMMRQANKLGAKYCVIIGEEEQTKKEVTIKNMMTGIEERIKQIDLVNYLKK